MDAGGGAVVNEIGSSEDCVIVDAHSDGHREVRVEVSDRLSAEVVTPFSECCEGIRLSSQQ